MSLIQNGISVGYIRVYQVYIDIKLHYICCRWNTIRTICDSNKKIGIALEITADLPSVEVLDRWCGEPIKCAMVPTSIFLTNRKGFPVLSKAHQTLLKKLFKVCYI